MDRLIVWLIATACLIYKLHASNVQNASLNNETFVYEVMERPIILLDNCKVVFSNRHFARFTLEYDCVTYQKWVAMGKHV